MQSFFLLEVGNLGGLVLMLILIWGGLATLSSLVVALIFKVIYENSSGKKLSKGQYWLVVFVCLCICGIIAGAICL